MVALKLKFKWDYQNLLVFAIAGALMMLELQKTQHRDTKTTHFWPNVLVSAYIG